MTYQNTTSIEMEIENEKVAKDSSQENLSAESAKDDEQMSIDDNEPGPSFAARKKRQKNPLSSDDDEILPSGSDSDINSQCSVASKNSKDSKEEIMRCQACKESFPDIFHCLKHLNKCWNCLCKYIEHKNMLDELKQNFLMGYGKELIDCICCHKLFPIDRILIHVTQSKWRRCELEYKSKKEWGPLNQKIKR